MFVPSEYYVQVDVESKEVLTQLQCLPENWGTISSMSALSEKELEDLTWAGVKGKGWVCLTSDYIVKYTASQENIKSQRTFIKRKISEGCIKRQKGGFQYQEYRVEATPENRLSYFMEASKAQSSPDYTQFFRFDEEFVELNSLEIRQLYDVLDLFMDKNLLWEKNLYSQLNSCKNLSEIAKLNYEYPWLCTTI
jgi:hypothetical protein